MSASRAKKVRRAAQAGARTVGGVISLILKIIGSGILIAVTTGIIFTCIFLVYVKTNLTADLDVKLEEFRLDLSSEIYCQNSETGNWEKMVTLQGEKFRKWVEYRDIPANLEHALVAIEDQRFYAHNGVDWYRTSGAFVNMFLGMKNTFGGSTITQQLIKNLTDEDETTVQRKLTEIFRALEFEKEYDDDQIIEWYLNIVYFGHGCYGIGAASEYYFGKDVSDLTLAECASIIGITNNPSMFGPYMNRERNKERQELILTKMYEQGYILETEYKKATSEKLEFKRSEGEKHEDVIYTWFEEAVIDEVLADLKEMGYTDYRAQLVLYSGGLKIYTTLDPAMQEKMDIIYMNPEELPSVSGSTQPLQSAMIIADPYTGDIKALSGGVGEKTGNRWRSRATRMRRPPGSSIKPLAVYAPAMDLNLITPDTRFDDSASVTLSGTTWMPKNDDRSYRGIVDIRFAVRRSLNTISAQVLDRLKPSVSYRFMRETLGFNLVAADEDYAPLSLGQLTNGATLIEMASGYTMFPNQGVRTELRTYTLILDSEGEVLIDKSKPKTVAAISATTAYWMTELLTNAVNSGTGSDARLDSMIAAGKTGTTSDKKDRWFCGYTPYYVAVVWTGYDTPAEMKTSGNPAGKIWKRVMDMVHEDLEPKQFEVPAVTQLPPVPGLKMVEYTIRCVTAGGGVLYMETQSGVIEREATAAAPEIIGYTLIGESSITITLVENPDRNIMEFTYELTPIDTEDPPVTDAPVTDGPVTYPPVTYPPVTDTPVTDTPVTNSPEPPVTDTQVIEPPVTDPTETHGGVVIPSE